MKSKADFMVLSFNTTLYTTLYLCCIGVIQSLKFKGFAVLIPVNTLMDNGVVYIAKISKKVSIRIKKISPDTTGTAT
jgi:hypothetical protein